MCRDCDYGYEKETDFRRGKVDVDDFYKEVNYQTRLKGRTGYRVKFRDKTRPGCPGNNFGPHIYVWTTEGQTSSFFSDYYGFYKYEFRICCGCGKKTKSRLSEPYLKIKARKWEKMYGGEYNVQRGAPVSKYHRWGPSYSYWHWENYDSDFVKARKEYIDRHGYPSYLYNYGW